MNSFRFSAFFLTMALVGCDYSLKRESPSVAGDFVLNVNEITSENPALAGVVNNQFQLLQNATVALGCKVGGDGQPSTGSGWGGNATNIGTFNMRMAVSFQFPVPLKPTAVTLRLKRTGSPTAKAVVDLVAAPGGVPQVDSVFGSSDTADMALMGGGAGGADQAFNFASAPSLSANQGYALMLRASSADGGALDGSNNIVWRTTDDISDCSDFDVIQNSANGGSSWVDDATAPYFTLSVPGYPASAAGYWIIDGGREVQWKFSTFQVSEDPSNDKPGTVTYSIGTGSDATTPSYSHTMLTLAQVRALPAAQGRYLYVRVNLASGSNNLTNASVGSGSISEL